MFDITAPLKRPRESESVGGRSGGGGDGDSSGKRHNTASGKEYAVDTGDEDAANGSNPITSNPPANAPAKRKPDRLVRSVSLGVITPINAE